MRTESDECPGGKSTLTGYVMDWPAGMLYTPLPLTTIMYCSVAKERSWPVALS